MLADSQRRDMLAAMGIDVYVLRATQAERADTPASVADWLIVAATAAAMKSTQCAHLQKWLPGIVGLAPDRVRWIAADAADSFDSVPTAQAYLVLGAALARSLGAHLSATQQHSAVIAVADEPALSFGNAIAKRALWQTLKPIARRARGVH